MTSSNTSYVHQHDSHPDKTCQPFWQEIIENDLSMIYLIFVAFLRPADREDVIST